MQPSFKKFLPVTLHVGLWAFLWLWIGLKFNFVLWIPFIGWASWYSIGPTWDMRRKRAPKNIIAALAGTAYAIAFILVFPSASTVFGALTIPVLGFFVGMTIVLLELTNWFEWAVGYFFAFAGFFAFVFAAGAYGAVGNYSIIFEGSLGPLSDYMRDAMYYSALILAGLAIGFITDLVRFKILKLEGLQSEAEMKTIFDKESTIKLETENN